MNSTVKLLTRGGRGETRLLLERDQKRDQAKSKGLEISSANCCHQLSTRTINPDFSLEQTHWLPLKWLILRQNETLSYPTEFFYTYPHSLYGFSRIHRFPQFPLGLRFRCVRPACSDGPLFILNPSAYASDPARKLWETLRQRSQYLFILCGPHSVCSSI